MAWQRLQAVRAIEFYRDHVLQTDEPNLGDIHQALGQAAKQEKARRLLWPGETESGSVGPLDTNEPEWLRQMRRELRLLHYSKRTDCGCEYRRCGGRLSPLDRLGVDNKTQPQP